MPGWNQENTEQHDLKIIHILRSRYQPKILGHIIKNKQKNKFVCIHEILRFIIMIMKVKMKKRYDINRPV